MSARTELERIGKQAARCTRCDLYKNATQTVFGEGRVPADFLFVGEQPGDQEDTQGHVFIGPAGRLLRRLLDEAEIDTKRVYLTNAVKHFKWEARGKRRIHKRPHVKEIKACRPWLEAELEIVKPKLVICLGAVAAHAIFGRAVTISKVRGTIHEVEGLPPVLVTAHPSSVLRAEDDQRADARKLILMDLEEAVRFTAGSARRSR
jgi:uracil-DNA glycosylase